MLQLYDVLEKVDGRSSLAGTDGDGPNSKVKHRVGHMFSLPGGT